MKLSLKKGEYYYRLSKTYFEKQGNYSYLVFQCIGFNRNNAPKTERVAAFYLEDDAKQFCNLKNEVLK